MKAMSQQDISDARSAIISRGKLLDKLTADFDENKIPLFDAAKKRLGPPSASIVSSNKISSQKCDFPLLLYPRGRLAASFIKSRKEVSIQIPIPKPENYG